MRLALSVLFLTACSSNMTDSTVDDYQAMLTDARAVLSDHTTAVQAASSVDDVGALEATYATAWAAMGARMDDQMGEIETCDMTDADMTSMDDVTAMMSDMDGLVADHVAAHDAHTELTQCVADETAHVAAMNERLDAMTTRGEAWRTSMHCSGGDMGM